MVMISASAYAVKDYLMQIGQHRLCPWTRVNSCLRASMRGVLVFSMCYITIHVKLVSHFDLHNICFNICGMSIAHTACLMWSSL